jgi:uncharacterized integral membrane protein
VRYLTWLITIPLSIFSVIFALSNTGSVQIFLQPFEGSYDTPVSLLGLGMMAAGFFLGAVFVWIHSQKLRWQYWQEKRKAERLQKECTERLAKEAVKTTALEKQ